ncbi:M56 family metallopeptidase [Chryseobacterium flavum]|uniref:M56 family metallopeptidase n=1 Tax=Chryseobacterium flavum TaxID=415851 RepID=UPI002FD8F625
MEAILLYFAKVIVCSGVMFLYYQLSLKDKTFHHYNRFYLLSAMLISLLLPLIRIDDFTIEVNNDVFMLLDKIQNFNTEKKIDHGYIYFNIAFSALGLVSLYFLGKLVYGIFKIQQFKKQFQKESFDGINFYRTDLSEAPFSYFKNLFWRNTITLHSDIGKQILKHEMVHIEQKHSFDKIFIEIITSVLWFNPFFHIIKKEINLIHEYLADKKAVKHSDTKAFAQMLLASHFSGTQLPASSPFLSSNLKKRLKMLQKPKTKFGYARRIFALPVLFSVAFAYMVNAKNKEIEETNINIQKAVSQIQKDTVRPGKIQYEEVKNPIPELPELKARSAEIQKELNKKSKELSKLKPETSAFDKKIEEITLLASEMGKIGDETSRLVDGYFKSPDWKNKMEALDNLKVEVPDLPDLDLDLPDPPSPPDAPDTPPGPPKAPRAIYFKNNNTVYYKDLSPKEKAEVRRAMKKARKAMQEGEKARIEGEKARIEGERALIESDRIRNEGDRIRIEAEKARTEARKVAFESMGNFKEIHSFKQGDAPKVIIMKADYIKRDGQGNLAARGIKQYKTDGYDVRYFINGSEVSKEEINTFKAENIASINVIKENKMRGIPQAEIRIQTKK